MISKIIRSSFSISIIALSACGGGGGSNGVATPSKPSKPSVPAASYNTLASNFVEIVNEYDIDSQYASSRTLMSQMPVRGTARYTGTGGFLADRGSDGVTGAALGQAVLNADFARKKLTGKVTNFKAKPGHTTTGGTLNVDTNIVGNEATGRLTGNVNLDGRTHRINNNAVAGFYGGGAEAVAVLSSGETTNGDAYLVAIAAEK